MIKSGFSVQIAVVRGLGTHTETNYVVEVGMWPYKSKHSRVWLALMREQDSKPGFLRVWGCDPFFPLKFVGRWILKLKSSVVKALIKGAVKGAVTPNDRETENL